MINFYPNAKINLAEKNKKKFKKDPDKIIIHYTGANSFESAVNWLTKKEVKASAHIVIGRKGEICQLVPFDTIAWHAGKSEWEGEKNLNNSSIGIELCNSGKLKKTGNKYFNNYKQEIPKQEVFYFEPEKTYWHLYTQKQYNELTLIMSFLTLKLGILKLLGHDEISPGRKLDPGPAFHWWLYR